MAVWEKSVGPESPPTTAQPRRPQQWLRTFRPDALLLW
ncbi:DUF6053 domain-containing protein [Lysobacter enzymogenes]